MNIAQIERDLAEECAKREQRAPATWVMQSGQRFVSHRALQRGRCAASICEARKATRKPGPVTITSGGV